MASIILPLVASGLGANSFWMSMAALAGGLIDQQIFATDYKQEQGKVSDLQIQTSSLGANIVRGWGTSRITGNIVWGTKFVEHKKTETQRGGKGGGGSSVTTTTYSYSVSFCVQICEGPIVGISNVWADGNALDMSTIDYTLYTGTESQMPDPFMEGIEGEGKVPAYRGTAYIVVKNLDLTSYGNRIPTLSFVVQFPTNDLAQIITDISTSAGVDISNTLDVSDLRGITIQGFTTSGDKTFRSQIEELQVVKVFDGIEIDGKVVFKRRSFDTVIPVLESDMGAYESSKPSEPRESERKYDMELPRAIKLSYPSSDNDYQTGVAPAFRQLTKSVTEKSVATSVVLSDSDARVVAETRLYEAWINRTTHEITLSNKFAFLRPSDIIELNIGTWKKLAIVVKTSYGNPGLMKISAADIDSVTYKTTARYVDGGITPTEQSATALTVYFLDLPRLAPDTLKDDNHMYVAVSADVFYGANIFKSTDGGLNWAIFAQDIGNATMGTASTILNAGITHQWDNANTVTVVLSHGTLENRSKVDVLNGYNTALLGNEIIQYKSAMMIATNTYVLSGLLRGRNGTEHQVGTHVIGEKFIVLNTSTINAVTINSTDWYKPIMFRVGPRNLPVTDPLYQNITVISQAVIAMPWAVCHVKGVRDSSGNLTISWLRRTRGDGTWKDYVDVPMDESFGRFDVEYYSVSTGQLVRSLQVNASSTTYLGTDQITDCGSLQGQIKVRIYQLSETRGRGVMKEVIL